MHAIASGKAGPARARARAYSEKAGRLATSRPFTIRRQRVFFTVSSGGITVLVAQHQQHKIRLVGIDAPEKAQAFGRASKKHLSDLVFDRNVTLDCGKTDMYRRQVCVVMIDATDANRHKVAAGMAWWYRKY